MTIAIISLEDLGGSVIAEAVVDTETLQAEIDDMTTMLNDYDNLDRAQYDNETLKMIDSNAIIIDTKLHSHLRWLKRVEDA